MQTQIVAVVLTALGGILIYSGIRNINPIATAQQLFGPGPNEPVEFDSGNGNGNDNNSGNNNAS